MLFEQRLRDGIHDGSITVAFRRWRRTQVVAGGRYRTGIDIVEVISVDVVDPAQIADADARLAGYPDAAAARADLRAGPDVPTLRIRLRRSDEPDPHAVLAATDDLTEADVAEIQRRLERLDKASPRGPWTRAILAAIADRPGTAAPILAESFGLETVVFKRNVRSLKTLGLTYSLRIGYQLSP